LGRALIASEFFIVSILKVIKVKPIAKIKSFETVKESKMKGNVVKVARITTKIKVLKRPYWDSAVLTEDFITLFFAIIKV
jgi:hypothetical protein